ncbi:MAG TPA: trypsin-like peptidase domain-containing protein [Acetobacteraceae bacterium]|nr:trypsin-like peptidase domain-containing protein [Acetobacteraceae bacterium]
MRTWMADLIGLAIGFALGGAVLVHFWPQIEQFRRPTVAVAQPAHAATPLPQVQTPVQRPPVQIAMAPVRPAPLPDIVNIVPAPAPLPQVNEPDEPEQDDGPLPPNMVIAGTGFFVTEHLVMTAAHVVPSCQRVAIISPIIPLSPVTIDGRDSDNDIALLRTSDVTAPAVLEIGRPVDGRTRVFMLGYPASAGLKDPESTWGTLENDKLQQVPTFNPRQHILMEASMVRHGYSGGAIFDPRSGKVVGIVRATLMPDAFRMVPGMPASGLAVGPGSALLDAFLQDEAPGSYAFPADQWGDDPISVLKRATVHVLCWD